jgi:Glucokinase
MSNSLCNQSMEIFYECYGAEAGLAALKWLPYGGLYLTGNELCDAMQCYVMLCHVKLCYVMLCYVMLCYVMLCYVMLCYVMLCYVMLCYVMSCQVMLCYVMSCQVMLCSALPHSRLYFPELHSTQLALVSLSIVAPLANSTFYFK